MTIKNKKLNAAAIARKQLDDRGISYRVVETSETRADGSTYTRKTVIIDKIPDIEREAILFFSPEQKPWFPGCEMLREKYRKELENPSRCKDCGGSLKRKYLRMVIAALNACPDREKPAILSHKRIDVQGNNSDNNSDETIQQKSANATRQTSGSAGEDESGAGQQEESLLRRTFSCIKKVFKRS